MEQQGKGILQVQKEKESANIEISIERFRDEQRRIQGEMLKAYATA